VNLQNSTGSEPVYAYVTSQALDHGNANISFVDFVCVPVALTLTGSAGTQGVPGLPGGSLDAVCAGLAAQAVADVNDWNELVVGSNGTSLRALSPTHAMVLSPGLLAGSFAAPAAADIFQL
jgi:hypothetical protein